MFAKQGSDNWTRRILANSSDIMETVCRARAECATHSTYTYAYRVVEWREREKYRGVDHAIVNNDTRSGHCLAESRVFFFIHRIFIICLSHRKIIPMDLHTQRYLDVEISREKRNRGPVSSALQFLCMINIVFVGAINNVEHESRDFKIYGKNTEI